MKFCVSSRNSGMELEILHLNWNFQFNFQREILQFRYSISRSYAIVRPQNPEFRVQSRNVEYELTWNFGFPFEILSLRSDFCFLTGNAALEREIPSLSYSFRVQTQNLEFKVQISNLNTEFCVQNQNFKSKHGISSSKLKFWIWINLKSCVRTRYSVFEFELEILYLNWKFQMYAQIAEFKHKV